MIAVDTNLLIYAHREDAPFHDAADRCLAELVESGRDWAIPWPCVHEFLAIVTHPRIFVPPTPLADALEQVRCWIESPTLHLLGELDGYWPQLESILQSGRVEGPLVHDAHVVAICQQHRVSSFWTADRDFSRFPALVTENPLLATAVD